MFKKKELKLIFAGGIETIGEKREIFFTENEKVQKVNFYRLTVRQCGQESVKY